MTRGELGAFVTPGGGHRLLPDVPWAGDNECFTLGDRFDGDRFVRWLDRQPHTNCLFVVAPDVVGDAAATLERSTPWFDTIRSMGFPVAFVGQDGVEDMLDDVPWRKFDAWFTGGSTGWKLSEASSVCASEAKTRGKWLHMGRVNSQRRVLIADRQGYDSVDGTYLAFGPDKNLPSLLGWMACAATQERLTL